MLDTTSLSPERRYLHPWPRLIADAVSRLRRALADNPDDDPCAIAVCTLHSVRLLYETALGGPEMAWIALQSAITSLEEAHPDVVEKAKAELAKEAGLN